MNQQVLDYLPLLAPLGTMAVVAVGFIFNNSRITDMKDLIKAESARLEAVLRQELGKTETAIRKDLASVEQRLTKLEDRVARLEDKVEPRRILT